MAFGGTYYSSGQPRFEWNITWAETGRNGSSVTYRVTANARMQYSTSYYNYNLNMRATINGKAVEKNYGNVGWRGNAWKGPWTFDITTSAGSGGGSHSAKFEAWSSNGGGSACAITHNGTVNFSTWNTAPTASGYITLRENNASGRVISAAANGTENANKFPENVSALHLSWPAASDKEGGTITYEIYRQVSESAFNWLANTTSTSYVDNIGAGNQNASYDYYIKTRDNYNTFASHIMDATQVQKNAFTKANLSIGSTTVTQDTTSISRGYSGAKNTNGNGTFTYSLACQCNGKNITVYNPANTASTITIYKSGTAPTSTYIKYDDIKNALPTTSYTGTLTFTLTTKNAYGSSGTSTASVNVNLQKDITISDSVKIDAASYTLINDTNYIVGNLKPVKITWGAATDTLNQSSIRYKLEYSTNNGSSWAVVSGANALTTTTYTTTISNTSGSTYKFRVTASNSYGKSKVYSSQPSDKVYYYNNPDVAFTSVERTTNKATLNFVVTLKTNLPGNAIVEIYADNGAVEADEILDGTMTINTRQINFSGLFENETFSVMLTVTDKIGKLLGRTGEATIAVEAYRALLALRANGVGILTEPGNAALAVRGNIDLVDDRGNKRTFIEIMDGDSTGFGAAIQTGGALILGGGEAASAVINADAVGSTTEHLYLAADSAVVIGAGVQNGWANRTAELVADKNLFRFKTFSTTGSSGIELVGSAVTGKLWCGASGFVVQSSGAGNLHLGQNNISDMVFYSNQISISKHVEVNGDTQFHFSGTKAANNVAFMKFNTKGDGNTSGDGNSYIGYRDTSGNYNHYFRGKGSFIVDNAAGIHTNKIKASQYWFSNDDYITYNDNTNVYHFVSDGGAGSASIKAGYYCFTYDNDYIAFNDTYNEFHFVGNGNYMNSMLVSGRLFTKPNSTEQTAFTVNNAAERTTGRTDLTIAPSKSNYGIFGRSSLYFYVGWAAGWKTPSYRPSKYDIRKTDDSLLYEYLKDVNIYNYRRVSGNEDEEKQDYDYRGDLQMGAMIEELPFEVVDHDTEVGEGKGVDLYGFSSLIAGAVRHLITKVEKLEEENNILKERLGIEDI